MPKDSKPTPNIDIQVTPLDQAIKKRGLKTPPKKPRIVKDGT